MTAHPAFFQFKTSMDDGLNQAFESFGLPRLGGASGRGWSMYTALQRCPYLYFRKYREPLTDGDPRGESINLAIGSCFHAFMALYYYPSYTTADGCIVPAPLELKDKLLELDVDAEALAEAWRLYGAYQFHYESEIWNPLAVELHASHPNGATCRYDLIVEIPEATSDYPAGTYIVDHKTMSRFDGASLEAWMSDGEIIGQQWIYEAAGLSETYGELTGSIVNIVGKQKVPQFARMVIPFESDRTARHGREIAAWNSQIAIHSATELWPRARGNCVGRYGLCDLFTHCVGKD